jgi:hypothetical protein
MGRKSGTAGTQGRSGVSHSAGAAAAETETISYPRTSAGSDVALWRIDKVRRTSGFSLPDTGSGLWRQDQKKKS